MKLPALVALILLAGPVVAAADALEDKYQSLKNAVTSRRPSIAVYADQARHNAIVMKTETDRMR
ncbi:MAG TPA: hypothetical protein VMH28_33825 [Candidatus Acidoferrales bacterium]|nr:hypothetical protein [Candidatus Acidoferrales bacterium]